MKTQIDEAVFAKSAVRIVLMHHLTWRTLLDLKMHHPP